MLKIRFEINGHEISAEKLATSLEKAMVWSIEESIRKKLSSVKCPIHGEHPEVICKGNNLCNLSFEIRGCCQELVEMAQKKLKGNT